MKVLRTDQDSTTILIRLMVGAVFLSEGIQKFLYAEDLGAGRFEKIGILYAYFFGPFVGSLEIICGVFVLIGLVTRFVAIPLIIIMLTAISTTKVEILLNEGLWKMLHESRTDWAMLLGCIFLFIKGGGRWSVDKEMSRERG